MFVCGVIERSDQIGLDANYLESVKPCSFSTTKISILIIWPTKLDHEVGPLKLDHETDH